MAPRNLLNQFRLTRNPFTDRTAEKTRLDENATYTRSDLVGFAPCDTTYLFFGRRGSGKTTIRLMMQTAYQQYNASPKDDSRGHYLVDLCTPGHMTACLTDFKECIGAQLENWDAQFQEKWSSADVVDCILSYAATDLVNRMSDSRNGGRELVEQLKDSPRDATQCLLLTHLYARTDAASLAHLRRHLIPPRYSANEIMTIAATSTAVSAGVVGVSKVALDAYGSQLHDAASSFLPAFNGNEKWYGVMAALGVALGTKWAIDRRHDRSMKRARSLQSAVRVVKPRATSILAKLVDQLFQSADTVDSIQSNHIGISAHQKLEKLRSLLQFLGFESLAVFGDCFDEVTLLDPVRFPDSIKVFAREACRNDLLNFGRLHLFFPDSRLGLDLSTDKMLKEARFDRHFVRDLTWSRHQLEDLAERRFRAAQESERNKFDLAEGADPSDLPEPSSFSDLFKQVRGEDFSSYISKLSTPRELMIVMSEMFARMEAHPEEGLTAQDMEIAVTKALEQSV